MKISELIYKLEAMKLAHGDLQCGVYVSEFSDEYSNLTSIENVCIDNDNEDGIKRIAIFEKYR